MPNALVFLTFCQPNWFPDNLYIASYALTVTEVKDVFHVFFQAILDVMVNLQFTLVETLWKTFWRFSQSQAGDAALAVWVAKT